MTEPAPGRGQPEGEPGRPGQTGATLTSRHLPWGQSQAGRRGQRDRQCQGEGHTVTGQNGRLP